VLRVAGLSQVFDLGLPTEVVALREVDLVVPTGQVVTIVGSNGAGKSTLLATIAGVYPCTRGRIEVDGRDVTGQPEHARAALIGRVFQNPLQGTAADMTVEQNLAVALMRGRPRRLGRGVTAARRAELRAALARLGLGLEERLSARVGTLSGGQRQALTLLMATLTGPRLLLLDEHTAALDPVTAGRVIELTDALIRPAGLTVLMVTHNLQHALEVGDRTLMMDRGRIALDLEGQARRGSTPEDLVRAFRERRDDPIVDDWLLLR
jgi:putative tryptophan/tyrosine transport system ATP-binding protein